MKTNRIFILAVLLLCAISGSSRKRVPAPASTPATINLGITENAPADKYANMNYGIRLNFSDNRENTRLIHVYDASTTNLPSFNVNPSISSFVPESIRRYMRTMGFNIDSDPATDYMMDISLTEFHVDYLSGIGWSATVMMDIKVSDHNHTLVYPSVGVVGRANTQGSSSSIITANTVMNQAYTEALKDIDWDRIAFFLNKPKENTATTDAPNNKAKEPVDLSKKLIYWNIDSRPAGADIYWRVVSASDEVNNQNSKHLDTTPYEATQALNIKGLTEDNASDVQILIRVEKDGYMPQTKKYNVQSIVDEKEIVSFFKLVKEDEE